MTSKRLKGRVVYSTDPGSLPRCTRCGEVDCRCTEITASAGRDAKARVQREKSGHGGKMVTVIYELDLPEESLKALCARLKKLCASGGTVKQRTIEIQGDHVNRLVEALKNEGYQVRRSGG